jgi:hypothetical protein
MPGDGGSDDAFYVRSNGENRGPVSFSQLRRGVAAGKIPLDARVARAGASTERRSRLY